MSARVFWPGDTLPVGAWVMARDGSVARVEFTGTTVNPLQPDPLVEVALPDYVAVVREAFARKALRTGAVS